MGSKDKATWKKNFDEFVYGPFVIDYEENLEIDKELYGGNDRACAIMFAHMLENNLEYYISFAVSKNLDDNSIKSLFQIDKGVLGNLGSKGIIAQAFGLIGKETKGDIDKIRMLRNAFAHSKKTFNFETPAIKGVCEQLVIPDLPDPFIPFQYLERYTSDALEYAKSMSNPKTRYIAACYGISHRMYRAKEESQPTDPLDIQTGKGFFGSNQLP